jgi:phosphate transport system substrate-binding protein
VAVVHRAATARTPAGSIAPPTRENFVNRSKRKLAFAGVVVLSLLAAACGSDDNGSSDTTSATGGAGSTSAAASTTTPPKVSGTLQASGSTFQTAYQQEAIEAFTKAHSGTTITYGGGGSGKGRTDLKSKTVDFAGSDAAYADADKPGEAILYFPVLLGPITISYHLDGVSKLKLSPDTIANIFQRKITTWNDPAIAADNAGVDLPDTPITVVHRTDGSGTTENFSKWLAAASPTAWTLKPGSTVEWPADTQGGSGNSGVAQIVHDTKGAVGYVDLSDAVAAKLSYADVENASGAFITPTADSASAAGDGITVPDDLVFAAYNSSAAKAYPITYQTWVIVYAKQHDAGKAALVKAYLDYLLTDGQQLLPDLDFAALPKSIQDKAVAQLDQITS